MKSSDIGNADGMAAPGTHAAKKPWSAPKVIVAQKLSVSQKTGIYTTERHVATVVDSSPSS
jgi:hypothetical protein